MMHFKALVAAWLLVPVLAVAQSVPIEGRLKQIRDTKTITLAYRTDALPFSFEDQDKQPTGYTIDLCRRIVNLIEGQIGVQSLQVKWVPVTVENRFDAVSSGKADMECGASTVTLTRMKKMGFSALTFVDGLGLLIRATTQGNSLADLGGKKIGVIDGTSNQAALAAAIKAKAINATVSTVKTREEGLEQLEAGTIDAFAGDKVLLVGLVAKAKDPKALALLGDSLSYEPYAIVLPQDAWSLRVSVDTAIAQIFSSASLPDIYNRWFAGLGRPSAALEAMYALGRIPQ